jgi:hypothetical protein
MPDEQKLSKDDLHYSNLENMVSLIRQTSVFPDIIRGHMAQAILRRLKAKPLLSRKP